MFFIAPFKLEKVINFYLLQKLRTPDHKLRNNFVKSRPYSGTEPAKLTNQCVHSNSGDKIKLDIK